MSSLSFKSVDQTKFNFAADLIQHQKATVKSNSTAVGAREGLDQAAIVTCEYFKVPDHMLDSIQYIKRNNWWNRTVTLAKSNLGAALDLLQEQMFEYSHRIFDAFSSAYPTDKGANAETNKHIVANIAMILGGFDNAFKSYLAFAKVAYEKFTAQTTQLGKDQVEQLKRLLGNTSHITSQVASSSKAMMRLIDHLAGVIVNSIENYNFDSSKFDIYDKDGELYLLPTNEFITETKTSFTDNLHIPTIKTEDDGTAKLIQEPVQSQAQSGVGGCMALGYHPGAGVAELDILPTKTGDIPSLMQDFFKMMDTAVCELVDARYSQLA